MSCTLRLSSAVLLFAITLTPAGATTISGAGGKRCGDFLQAVELKSEVAINGYVSWAQGFLSGYNWLNAQGRDIAIDPSGLNYALVNYCGAHKDTPFYQAVQQLTSGK
jgi:hypothetical protein